MTRTALSIAAVVATALVVVTGCSSSGGAMPTGRPTTPHPSSSTSPDAGSSAGSAATSSPSLDPDAAAATQAQAFVPVYLAELDTLYSDPAASINDIYAVAVQPESTHDALGIAQYRSANHRQAGTQRLVSVSGISVHLAGLGGTTTIGTDPTVQLSACVDVSAVTVTDAQGRSVGNPTAPAYLIESLTIVNIASPSPAGWRVSDAPNRQATSCGA